MIVYIAFFDKVAGRYCSDLIPCDDSKALIYRCAKRFSFNKYCHFVKPQEIECHTIAKWDSEKDGLIAYKKPVDVFTLDMVDELYKEFAYKNAHLKVDGVTMPEVSTDTTHGEFIRQVEEKKLEEGEKNEE